MGSIGTVEKFDLSTCLESGRALRSRSTEGSGRPSRERERTLNSRPWPIRRLVAVLAERSMSGRAPLSRREALSHGRQAWPAFHVDDDVFSSYVAERAPAGVASIERASELY